MDGSGRRHAGLLTAAELSGWKARVEAPTEFTYAGGTVYKTAPWGQGPVFLQQLALLRGFDLSPTHSAHWFVNQRINKEIGSFLDEERRARAEELSKWHHHHQRHRRTKDVGSQA